MNPCERKCWSCGNVAMHEDDVTPGVLCKKCGSQDTRLLERSRPTDWAAIGKRMEQAAKDGYSLSFVQCITNETFEVWMNKFIDRRITGSSTVLAEAIEMALDKAEKEEVKS
jgi:DNA-directed RNA polymerase subunit RPC12/RpoP